MSPLAGKRLRYLIDLDSDPGIAGAVTEIGYDATELPSLGDSVVYINRRYEKNRAGPGPYKPEDDIERGYGEKAAVAGSPAYWDHINGQSTKWLALGAKFAEVDNLDTDDVLAALRLLNAMGVRGLGIVVKNAAVVPGEDKHLLLQHSACVMALVENGCGSPAEYEALRVKAGKPYLPIRFVAYADGEGGREWADRIANEILAAGYVDMAATYSPKGEYASVTNILLPTKPAQNITGNITMPAQVTGADVVAFARSCIGKYEDGPDVPMLARAIAAAFPDDKELQTYVHQASNTMPWCADFTGFVWAHFGWKPPPVKNGVGFFYVDRWEDAGTPVPVGQQQPGDIVGYKYEALHHIGIWAGNGKTVGGNQSDAVTETTFSSKPSFVRRPPGIAGAAFISPQRGLIQGDTGAEVEELQRLLGFTGQDVDGEFGDATEAAVRSFQAAHGLDVDGEVGDLTWGALRTLQGAPTAIAGLSPELAEKIATLAASSALASYGWKGRGRAPIGYIKGVTLVFARCLLKLKAANSAAVAMTAPIGSSELDALALYGVTGTDRAVILRRLFVLLYGLGMRESSGDCFEGLDTSASNTGADEAEAGLFQQSWNSHAASPEIGKLFDLYSSPNAPLGFLQVFREGLSSPLSANWGTGQGERFQALCKASPAFACEAAAVGLRVLRTHWGPVKRLEAEMRPEAEALLTQVQALVDAAPSAPVVTPPEPTTPVKPPVLVTATIESCMARLDAVEAAVIDLRRTIMADPITIPAKAPAPMQIDPQSVAASVAKLAEIAAKLADVTAAVANKPAFDLGAIGKLFPALATHGSIWGYVAMCALQAFQIVGTATGSTQTVTGGVVTALLGGLGSSGVLSMLGRFVSQLTKPSK